jgi:hypothetical protein
MTPSNFFVCYGICGLYVALVMVRYAKPEPGREWCVELLILFWPLILIYYVVQSIQDYAAQSMLDFFPASDEQGDVVQYHHMKCWPEPFAATMAGIKNYEFRKDDRLNGYQIGDILVLREWQPPAQDEPWDYAGYTGRRIQATVTYISRGPDFGIPEGYCVMGLKDVKTVV